MRRKDQKFIDQVLAIHAKEPEQENIGYMARALVIATLPHSKPKEFIFQRQNGHTTLTMMANPKFGLPYGSLPRLILAWMTKEALRLRKPELELGQTLSDFLKKLNLSRQGGERGDITRLKNQMLSLLTTQISILSQDDKEGYAIGDQYHIAKSFNLWWNPLNVSEEKFLKDTRITLSTDFYNELIQHPVPLDFRVLHALRRSPLQIDIYTWLTYRMSYLKRETTISWRQLKWQLGGDYSETPQGVRDFKREFLKALHPVCVIYRDAKIEEEEGGIVLFPSRTHVKKKVKKDDIQVVDNPVDSESY